MLETLFLLSLLVAPARAGEGPRLPSVERAVEPRYPQDALESGQASSVLLGLVVSEQGRVLEATVLESGGVDFDAAALDAILGYTFVPAADEDGQPAAAQIQYRMVFEPTEVRTPAPLPELPPEAPTPRAALDDGEGLEVLVVGDRISTELNERRFSAEEIQYLPGSSGDVVKAVQNLPGIARAPLGIGQLIVRGSDPESTLYNLDGSPIPLVFHFSGLTSVVPSQALDEVAFLPGNGSVRYGRNLGGVVDLRTTRDLPVESTRMVSVDLYQSAAFVEQRLGEHSALSVSARRSYADVVLGPILSRSPDLQVQAPRYWDGQIRLQHEGATGTWDVMVYASDDRFRFLGLSEDEEEVLAAFADQFGRLRVRHLDEAGDWTRETTLAFGPERRFFEFGSDNEALEQTWGWSARQEWAKALEAEDRIGARIGADVLGGREDFEFYLAGFGKREIDQAVFAAPALYGELSLRLGPVTLTPGLRADALAYDTGYATGSLDPRVAALASLGDSTQLKASLGRYSAFPGLREVSSRADGNPDLGPEHSLQASAGVEQSLPMNLRLEATVYGNRMRDLVVGREDRLEFFSGPPPVGPFDTGAYANEGVGLSYGAELLLRYDGRRALGLLTATWSHSERRDRPDEPTELFAYDQPWVVNALWSQELARGWRLGGRFRYGSGNPYTPVVNRWYDTGSRAWVPVYGERSSQRLDPFKSLDLRVDKLWELRLLDLTAFLEVQNVTNAQNVEVLAWSADYSEQEPITGFPPLPVFGLRGAW
jgi:TonB family protein